MKILLIEDDESHAQFILNGLREAGHTVDHAKDGMDGMFLATEEKYDVMIVDRMVPKLDGLEVCRRLRAASTVPIIMLTARDDELDKVVGLELGADDYITKPFSIREFRSRVRALLRRASPNGENGERLAYMDLELDLAMCRARVRPPHVRSSTSGHRRRACTSATFP